MTYNKIRLNTAQVAEAHAIDFVRGPISDAFSASDLHSLAYGKIAADNGALTDSNTVDFGKAPSDSANLTETQEFDLGTVRTDSASVAEAHEVSFSSVQADTGSLTDDHAVSYGSVQSDSAGLTDSDTKAVDKVLTDSGSFTDDDPVFNIGKNPSDSGSLADLHVVDLSKTLADSGSVAESFSRVVAFSRSFTETIYVTDDVNGAAVDDDQNAQFFKNLTNIGSTSDSEVKSVGKNPSDSANFTESGAYEVQDYVDTMTYFAENYVGTTGSLF
jgi:hypothetical protein